MWTFLVIFGLFAVGLPLFWFWLWWGQLPYDGLRGPRLEIHREHVMHSLPRLLPLWGFMVLMTVQQAVELSHVPWKWRLFWDGFQTASILFLMGFMTADFVRLLRVEREKRRQREDDNLTRDAG